jgi:3-hydroxyisobutyrate dehydrogenase-like beta-hydroxyacid dehydrogenase
VAITSLSNDDAVKTVALGKDGVRSALAEDATYVDASTVAPSTSAELAEAFTRFVAMPILGAPPLVASGEAIYLVGAEDGCAEAVAPLFPALSEKRISYSHPSQAAVAKLTVNLMLLDSVVALAEAFGTGRAGGLSDDQLRELLGESPMVAPGIKSRFEGILTGHQDPLWTALLGAKDAGLALLIAESNGVKLPLTSTARGLYEEAASRSHDADIAAVSELYR